MTEDECMYLERILAKAAANHNKLNSWEKSFVEDTNARYEKYGADTRMSPKQWQVLDNIDKNIDGEKVRR